MLWSTVTLLGLDMACLHLSKLVQSVRGDIVSYVNGHMIRKELNTHICAVADAVQDFANGDVIVKNLEIVFEIFPIPFPFLHCSNTYTWV
jgi:hypothetical protein